MAFIKMPKPRNLAFIGVWLVIAAVSVAIPIAYAKWKKAHNLGGVPLSFDATDELLSTEAVAGFAEGCGLRVHRISDQTAQRIRAEGLSFLSKAKTGRDGGRYYNYGPWSATPPGHHELVLRGLACVPLENPNEAVLAKAIEHATNSSGSFYATGREYDIVVIPSLGVVVVSFSG